jgi:hypothetical protein
MEGAYNKARGLGGRRPGWSRLHARGPRAPIPSPPTPHPFPALDAFFSSPTQPPSTPLPRPRLQVLGASQQLPGEFAAFYVAQLASTVRDEVASCSERAYASLPLGDAQRLMMFGSAQEAAAYAKQVGARRGAAGGLRGVRGQLSRRERMQEWRQAPARARRGPGNQIAPCTLVSHSAVLPLLPHPRPPNAARLGGPGRPRHLWRPRRRRRRRRHGRRRRRRGRRRGRRRRRGRAGRRGGHGSDPELPPLRQGAGAHRVSPREPASGPLRREGRPGSRGAAGRLESGAAPGGAARRLATLPRAARLRERVFKRRGVCNPRHGSSVRGEVERQLARRLLQRSATCIRRGVGSAQTTAAIAAAGLGSSRGLFAPRGGRAD